MRACTALTAIVLCCAAAGDETIDEVLGGSPVGDETIDEVLGELPIGGETVVAAGIQLEAGEFAAAAALAEAAITRIERDRDRYDITIAEPLIMLGDAKLALGDAQGALSAYDRALHITRVNAGLHAPEQVEVVYREADAYVKLGDMAKANDRQEYAYQILLRSNGASSGELIPALFRLAEWYKDTYNIFSARGLYEHAAKLAETHLDPGDPLMIKALRGLAGTYRMERFPPPDMPVEAAFVPMPKGYRDSSRYQPVTINNFAPGERALIYIVKMIQDDPTSTQADMARALLDLGDWFLLFEKMNRAIPVYKRVWSILAASDRELLAASFEQPTPLYLPLPGDPPPPPLDLRGDPQFGVVELQAAVNERGEVTRLETVRSEPEGMMDFRVRRAARRARYRPAFEDGAPVDFDALKLEYTFTYYPAMGEVSERR